ncbi:MAG: MurR/RpiR family transcriptional regulator [Spiroplasma sp. WSS]|uniref:MurR/RpiR family transcriptional regulator n=1 Tax=Spiroplasma TaxID=2132 RepID=UPI0012045F16|nr:MULTISPECIES: MurR/RpiR family transcriptional regulator [Spiroplasma]TLF25188.1 MAG: MurR/RpiR family transcriptional regulator [Spiroplasma sp. WSS]WJG70793.1 MurR/RpiR family transcriptional regulator [Spiroplasma ixodetis Y32]
MLINDNFWSRVSKEENNFTKKEKVLINYINKNSQKMDQVTISSLAKENTVGYSVVYNLIKKLGFKGYREFIISLAAQETTFKALNREFFGDRSVLKEHYKKLMDLNDSTINYEELQRFINWIDDNRKACIYLAGIGHSGLGAEDLSNKLYRFGLRSICLNKDDDSILMHASLIIPEDVIILFSLSGKTATIVEAAKLAKKNNAKIAVVTSQDKTELVTYADWTFNIVSSGLYEAQEIFISPLFAITYFNDLVTTYLLKSKHKDWYLENRIKTNKVIKKFN